MSVGDKSSRQTEDAVLSQTERPTVDDLPTQTNLEPLIASTCQSPDTVCSEGTDPATLFLNQGQQQLDPSLQFFDYDYVPDPSLWFSPLVSPSLDSSQAHGDGKCENSQETKPGSLDITTAQRKRREQNRAAQRNFRQRKETHLRTLEATIITAEARRTSLKLDNEYLQRELARLSFENDRLRRGSTCSKRECCKRRKSRNNSTASVTSIEGTKKGTPLRKIKSYPAKVERTLKSDNDNNEFTSTKPCENKLRSNSNVAGVQSSRQRPPLLSQDSRTNTTSSNESDQNINTNSTSSARSRSISVSSMSSIDAKDRAVDNVTEMASPTPSISCQHCDRPSAGATDTAGNTKGSYLEERQRLSRGRLLISVQQAFAHVQSHELFHKGVIDIEKLLRAFRRIAQYYEGATLFDRAEVEASLHESAQDGVNDELI